MRVLRSVRRFQRAMEGQRLKGKTIGFVPTMGALHEGHLSLVREARRESDTVVVSVFVNPLQFGPREDLAKYPATFSRDRRLLKAEGVDVVFFPSVQGMYPKGFRTTVAVKKEKSGPDLTGVLCGRSRPGHFEGVATVIVKLVNLVKPHSMYLGAKDFQQTVVVKRVLEDLNSDVALRVLPIIREADGLALSSRNLYLKSEERRRAAAFPRVLFWVKKRLAEKELGVTALRRQAISRLRRAVDKVDYLELVDPETLQPAASSRQRPLLVAAACFVGKTRLIDNVIIKKL